MSRPILLDTCALIWVLNGETLGIVGQLPDGFGKADVFDRRHVRWNQAEHGVGATYVKLAIDGTYKVIDREHMGIFLTDEGHWKQVGAVITFSPKDSKKSSYQATENDHNGKAFLAITSPEAAAGIVIAADDIDEIQHHRQQDVTLGILHIFG